MLFRSVSQSRYDAEYVLMDLVKNGHQLVLFTMRSDIVNPEGGGGDIHLESGNYLSDAVNWFKRKGIPLYGVQSNPTQHEWTTSPKAYAQLYIDDAALGCPLLYPGGRERPYVNWNMVRIKLEEMGLLSSAE